MFILTGSRASGKTYNLLRECNNKNGVVLVRGELEAHNMKEYAKALGFKNVRVLTYSEYSSAPVRLSPLYIDSLEDLFKTIFLRNVAGAATNTAEVFSLNPYRVIEEDESMASKVFKEV